jgi:hypothetical protein
VIWLKPPHSTNMRASRDHRFSAKILVVRHLNS